MRLITSLLLLGLLFPIVNAQELQMGGMQEISYEDLYNDLQQALISNQKIVSVIDNSLWVPWYKTSSNSRIEDLQNGNSCNNQIIDYENNCMVTDELSQLGIIIAMGEDENIVKQYVNTLHKIRSDKGIIPAWRILRQNDQIYPCKEGINGNCDTASDATARIIISLYAASINENFERKTEYKILADQLVNDMLNYEILNNCKMTQQGNICYWLAAGSEAKKGGLHSNDFAYTGYYPDSITAMLMACSKTENKIYCDVAKDLAKNFLLASNFDQQSFSVPPGRSFKWVETSQGIKAECTNTCNPVMWDSADAPRALALCQNQKYAKKINVDLGIDKYCELWMEYNQDPNNVPLQFYPNGSPVNYVSGYFAQGLQSLSIYDNNELYEQTLRNALSHYSTTTKVWDFQPVFGIYHAAIPFRSLGEGLGRLNKVFDTQTNNQETSIANYEFEMWIDEGYTINYDNIQGDCRTIKSNTKHGILEILACKKDVGVEVYRQQQPSTQFKSCFGNGCIDEIKGFAIATQTKIPIQETTFNPEDISTYNYELRIQDEYNIIIDNTLGDCRTIKSNTKHGPINVLACKKPEGHIELYRQEHPTGISFKACLENACVDEISGFAII